jgi:hypothetical protein
MQWQGQAHFFAARGVQGTGGRTASRSKLPAKKKSAQQKQLEENVKRTIYICDIDRQVMSKSQGSRSRAEQLVRAARPSCKDI